MTNIAIFASGSGSNFEELVLKAEEYKVKFLFTNKKNSKVLERAKRLNIDSHFISVKDENFYDKLDLLLRENNVELIVLAGYMKLLARFFVDKWEGRIINIHPSLLPKYPGLDSIKKSYLNKEKETGITIHYVNEKMDDGEIIIQKSIEVNYEDSLESLEKSVHKLEHEWYPKIINELSERKIWKEL